MPGEHMNGLVASRPTTHRLSLQVPFTNHLLYPRPQYSAGPTASAPGKDASKRVGRFRRASKYTAATAEWVSTHLRSMPLQTGSPNLNILGSRSEERDGRS